MTTAKATKKGTSNTELIIGSAVGELKKVIANVETATEKIADLAAEAEKQQGIIAQREDQIKELDVTFAETKRQKEVQMAVELKENEKKTVDGILEKQSLVAVDKASYAKFTSDLETIKADASKDAQKEIHAATGSMKKQHENEIALMKAGFEKDQASTTAQLAQTAEQIKFLQEQVNMWKGALDAERSAGVERAKASSIGTVSITGAGKN